MRQLMHYLQMLPEEGQVNLLVEGKILPCKEIKVEEDLIVATSLDDTLWYLDPDKIAGFCSGAIGDLRDFFSEEDWEREYLPDQEGKSTIASQREPSRQAPIEAPGEPMREQPPQLPSPKPEKQPFWFLKYKTCFQRIPECLPDAQAILDRLSALARQETVEERDAQEVFAQIRSAIQAYPQGMQGFSCLRASLYALLGKVRSAAAIFCSVGRLRDAIALLDEQKPGENQEMVLRLIGYYLICSKGETLSVEEADLPVRYAQLCKTPQDASLFIYLAEEGLDDACQRALYGLVAQSYPQRDLSQASQEELLELLTRAFDIQKPCDVDLYAEGTQILLEDLPLANDEPVHKMLLEGERPVIPFFVSTVKARSASGYQQAYLYFREEGQGEEAVHKEIYLNPKQVLDPMLGELLQKGTDLDIQGLPIAFTPILNDRGVAGGDAFLTGEAREKLFRQVCSAPPKWLKHEFFIRYGRRGFAEPGEMEEVFGEQATQSHAVKSELVASDWEILRFLRMVLCGDVADAMVPAVFLKKPQLRRCSISLARSFSEQEKNLWLSRLHYHLEQLGQQEQMLLIDYFCYGLPRTNSFFIDFERQQKVRKEALWVKLMENADHLRLTRISEVAKEWRAAMLKDRRVSDPSALKDTHQKAWHKVTGLETMSQAILSEDLSLYEDSMDTLMNTLSDSEKGKLPHFLEAGEKLARL